VEEEERWAGRMQNCVGPQVVAPIRRLALQMLAPQQVSVGPHVASIFVSGIRKSKPSVKLTSARKADWAAGVMGTTGQGSGDEVDVTCAGSTANIDSGAGSYFASLAAARN
jgi:hypothetical protein